MLYTTTESPIGELLLAGDEEHLQVLWMGGAPEPDWVRADAPFAAARTQLGEYFAGERLAFDLALAPAGTPFQQAVWEALRAIPYGTTTSYGALAAQLGRPGAARAVGAANGRNPIAVVVPCHRVVGADRSLTGFGGGLERKRTLLALEAGSLFATP
jgi:methylated-DNA-[protein]-cysteine S-methyltransferase